MEHMHDRRTQGMMRSLPGGPSRRRALTLVEILAVVVILGMISATLFVSFYGSFGRARHELARTQIGIIVGKLEVYRIEHGDVPSNDVGLGALTAGQAAPADAYYLEPGQLLDPWKRPYLYITPGPDGRPFEVSSYGADGQAGGDAENADISSAALTEAGS